MIRVTIKQLLFLMSMVGIVLAVAMFFWRNLDEYSVLLGYGCLIAFPMSPLVFGLSAYFFSRKYHPDSKTTITILGVLIGIVISVASYFLFDHIVWNYWV